MQFYVIPIRDANRMIYLFTLIRPNEYTEHMARLRMCRYRSAHCKNKQKHSRNTYRQSAQDLKLIRG